jgi:hypothetical protein
MHNAPRVAKLTRPRCEEKAGNVRIVHRDRSAARENAHGVEPPRRAFAIMFTGGRYRMKP